MLKYIFFNFVVRKYSMSFFLILGDLVVCMKTRHFFSTFRRKPGILIPYLYLYSIKIQTNINQNGIKILKRTTNF
jgi:hypothetical protein